MTDRPLHVGIGNPFRQDDGVGPWLSARLARHGLRARDWPGDGAGLLDLFATEPAIVLIDATRSGAVAGTIRCIDARMESLPRALFHNSTHDFGMGEAVEVARALGELPDHLMIIGIEGRRFGLAEGLSPPVLAAARRVAADLLKRNCA